MEGLRPLFFMPFKSEKQRRYLYANLPEVAAKFAAEEKAAKAKKKRSSTAKKKSTTTRRKRTSK
jgi:hypothetical protein